MPVVVAGMARAYKRRSREGHPAPATKKYAGPDGAGFFISAIATAASGTTK